MPLPLSPAGPGSAGPPPLARLLGARLANHGPGFATVALDLGPSLCSPDGATARGVYAALAELAMDAAVAGWAPRGPPLRLVSLSLVERAPTGVRWMEAFARVAEAPGADPAAGCTVEVSVRRSDGTFAEVRGRYQPAGAGGCASAPAG